MRIAKFMLVAVLGTFLAGCTTPATVTRTDTVSERRAANFEVAPDRAKVYFVNGKIVGNLFGLNHRYPSDLFVDSQPVGSMNKENVMVFDLPPGKYKFSWNVRSTDMIDKKTVPRETEFRVAGGDVLVLRGDWDPGASGSFGLIGAMISPPKTEIRRGDRADVGGKEFVLPQTCDVSLCLK